MPTRIIRNLANSVTKKMAFARATHNHLKHLKVCICFCKSHSCLGNRRSMNSAVLEALSKPLWMVRKERTMGSHKISLISWEMVRNKIGFSFRFFYPKPLPPKGLLNPHKIKQKWYTMTVSTLTHILSQTLPWKSRNFCWIVEHDRHYRRIVIA